MSVVTRFVKAFRGGIGREGLTVGRLLKQLCHILKATPSRHFHRDRRAVVHLVLHAKRWAWWKVKEKWTTEGR